MKTKNQNFETKDLIALVTGANRGIGRAITEGLLDAGAAKVYTAVRNISTVNELIDTYGERVVPVEFDLTRKETVDAAASIAGDVNLVVSNAGVIKIASPVDENMIEVSDGRERLLSYPFSAGVWTYTQKQWWWRVCSDEFACIHQKLFTFYGIFSIESGILCCNARFT